MGQTIGPKEAATRAMREAQFEESRRKTKATLAELKTGIAAVPAKKAPKAKKKRL